MVTVGGLGAALVTVPFVGFGGATLTLLELELSAFDELELSGLDDEAGGAMTPKLDLALHSARDLPFGQHVESVQ